MRQPAGSLHLGPELQGPPFSASICALDEHAEQHAECQWRLAFEFRSADLYAADSVRGITNREHKNAFEYHNANSRLDERGILTQRADAFWRMQRRENRQR